MQLNHTILHQLSTRMPDAICKICGSESYPNLKANASFWKTGCGILIAVSAEGLPITSENCSHSVFALHIHNGACSGTEENPFADADGHYNPCHCPHPEHAGDLPPLFSDPHGCAWGAVWSKRFSLSEIIGKVMIIHAGSDDFHTQPSGNSGKMIACGTIKPYRRRC